MEFRLKPDDLRDLVDTIAEVEKTGFKVNYILIEQSEMSMVLMPLTLGKITDEGV